MRALAAAIAKDWNGRVVTGDDLRAAIAKATPLTNPRLSEVEWDEVAGVLRLPGESQDCCEAHAALHRERVDSDARLRADQHPEEASA